MKKNVARDAYKLLINVYDQQTTAMHFSVFSFRKIIKDLYNDKDLFWSYIEKHMRIILWLNNNEIISMLSILDESDCLKLLDKILVYHHNLFNIKSEKFNCIKKEKSELKQSRLLMEKLEKM